MSNSVVVIKVGSSLISQGSRENSAFFKRLAKCIQKFRENDFDAVLVSSGAISYGMKKRGIEKKPKNIKQLQSLSAVGQIGLINAYQKNFDKKFFIPINNSFCEPQLSKRKLYPPTSTLKTAEKVKSMMNVLSYVDGKNSIIEIANLCHLSKLEVKKYLKIFRKFNLIK